MHLFDFLGRSKSRPLSVTVTRATATAAAGSAPLPAPLQLTAVAKVAKPNPPGPEELRRLIFSAIAAGDSERLTCLCRENEKGLLEYAGDWVKVPEELRSNPAAMRWYGEGLRAVARFCADALNRPDLFQRLEELGLATPAVN